MKLKLFNDGTAIFTERKSVHSLNIKVDTDGYIHIGSNVFPIKSGVATIGTLPTGDYEVKVISGDKIYRAYEHIVVSDAKMATIDSTHLRKVIIPLKETVESLVKEVSDLKKQVNEHERKISGYSLFGE